MPPNTTPALQNFEIHGTSKKRYDSIHDTIQLFNLMKEERDAVLQGKSPAGNERRQMYRSPSLLGYNKDLDGLHLTQEIGAWVNEKSLDGSAEQRYGY